MNIWDFIVKIFSSHYSFNIAILKYAMEISKVKTVVLII